MTELDVGPAREAPLGACQHRFGVVDRDDVRRGHSAAAAPVEYHAQEGAGAAGHFQVTGPVMGPEESELRTECAVIGKRENQESPGVVPPWRGLVGFCDFVARLPRL